jgi:uncharacterized OB-fold protein
MHPSAVHRDDRSAPFFNAAADGQLLIKRCTGCGHFLPLARIRCSICQSAALEWAPASGVARLVSWVVVHGRPASPDDEPERSWVGLVELEEGPWMYAALIDVDEADLAAGTGLSVDFVTPPDSEPIPVFRVQSSITRGSRPCW